MFIHRPKILLVSRGIYYPIVPYPISIEKFEILWRNHVMIIPFEVAYDNFNYWEKESHIRSTFTLLSRMRTKCAISRAQRSHKSFLR